MKIRVDDLACKESESESESESELASGVSKYPQLTSLAWFELEPLICPGCYHL